MIRGWLRRNGALRQVWPNLKRYHNPAGPQNRALLQQKIAINVSDFA
jgi:hypothetical protein